MSSSDSELELLEDSPEPQSTNESVKTRRLWTKQEDEKLRLLVSYWGDQGGRRSNWDKIAANFEDRTAKGCRKRWFHSLDPKLRRGRWNKSEDKILKESYDRLGPSWQRIAQLIPGRTDDQCAKRYNDVVNPAVQDRLRPWLAEEDEKLLGLYAKFGSRWQTIASNMPGRTGLTCRNRWRKLTRPQKPTAANSKSASSKADGLDDKTLNGSRGSMTSPDNIDIGIPFDVPGSNQVAGFPAGADANWFIANGNNNNNANANVNNNGYGMVSVNGSPIVHHNTITIEDPNNPDAAGQQQVQHHAILNEQLDRILEFAAKNQQQIVIHQHIYQMQQQAQPNSSSGQSFQGLAASSTSASSAIANNTGNSQVPLLSTPLPAFPPGPGITENGSSTLLRMVHPPVQPPERPPSRPNVFMTDEYSRPAASEQQLPPPPPDEFLSRPLLFEEQQQDSQSQFEEVDFLAFNPS